MGEDHDARKRSKKRRKGAATIDRELAAEGGKRKRSKKNRVRSKCTGMCYQEPVLQQEDLEQGGGEGFGAHASGIDQSQQDAGHESVPASEQAERPRGKKPSLSTGVNLLSAASAGSGPKRSAAQKSPLSEGFLASYPPSVQSYMNHQGFSEFTPIQERAWGPLFAGKDVFGVAEPGSGKTLAYLLPVVSRLASNNQLGDGIGAVPIVILLPSRELVQQVAAVCRTLRRDFGVRTVCLIGGKPKKPQLEAMKKGAHILVATLGRLWEVLESSEVSLGRVRYVVIDEADKMMEDQKVDQLHGVKPFLYPVAADHSAQAGLLKPQVAFFSATMRRGAVDVSRGWLTEAETIRVGPSSASISRTIIQVVQVCAEHKKPKKLLKHLTQIKEKSEGQRNPPRVLIFANRIKTVVFLQQLLEETGHKVVMLHGDRDQVEREAALLAFRAGKAQIMVATNVAARGLHIQNLPYVVNYDFPGSIEDYIHRVGRTGRLASHGHAFSFFTRNLACLAAPVIALLQEHDQSLDPHLVQLAESYQVVAKLEAAKTPEAGPDSSDPGSQDDEWKLESKKRKRMARLRQKHGIPYGVLPQQMADEMALQFAERAEERAATPPEVGVEVEGGMGHESDSEYTSSRSDVDGSEESKDTFSDGLEVCAASPQVQEQRRLSVVAGEGDSDGRACARELGTSSLRGSAVPRQPSGIDWTAQDERRAGRGVPHIDDDSQDEEAVLERMFANQQKKRLTKGDLPGLYKKQAGPKDGRVRGEGGPGPGGHALLAGKKRASLPGRLRKKLRASI